ncbi:hypothetical protein N7478_002906 [Penicillium angulare]|uniref:uncharacterized protein n=1 Tax=Penicillium angulare TaxID=116970 RepID=UPI00253FD28F|nr:uncharacterized protein N7478_002906 [Penicillium angulare]KAJ5287220.1 hypothetical protein N7478_002906 [Penicillium angulare]
MCFYGWTVCLTVLCLNKGERHHDDLVLLGDAVVSRVTLVNWIAEAFGTIGLATGKVSIAALLLSILGPTNWFWHKLYLWSVCIVLAGLISISCAILGIIQCSPPAALWDSSISGVCIGDQVIADYGVFNGAFCTFVYATLAIIPSGIFFKLQMTLTQKWQLSIVFAFNIL